MDRRQKKTREAIFKAFSELLSEKHYHRITVGEIIERANIGRATFYAHFETKDFLLKELCAELFCHIFDAAGEGDSSHRHIFKCDAPDSVILHLFMHLQKNDNGILKLLACDNNELFLRYFKTELKKLISEEIHLFAAGRSDKLPKDFFVDHVCSVFVDTVRWWMENGMKESADTLAEYFLAVV